MTQLETSAFENCTSLTSITIPDFIKTIKGSVFKGCTSLNSITLPDNTQIINEHTFEDCTSLTSITIPEQVRTIGYCAFMNCSSLSSIIIPYSDSYLGTTLKEKAFYGCSSLTSVTLPKSVRYINDSAFRECSNLKEVYCYAEIISLMGSNVFKDSNVGNCTLYVPAYSSIDYKAANQWKEFGMIKTIMNISEAKYATYYNGSLSYMMPEGLEGYIAYVNEGNYCFEKAYQAGDVVPAREPVVLKGNAGEYELVYTEENGVSYKAQDMNCLYGTKESATTTVGNDDDYYFYALSLNAESDINSVGFYWMAENGAPFTNGSSKAYLALPKAMFATPSQAKAFRFSIMNDDTGISSVRYDKTNTITYNLFGQKVPASSKGIIIRDGKKIYNK